MQRPARANVHAEVVPLRELIVAAIDRKTGKVTVPKGAHSTVPDDGDVGYIIAREEIGERRHDSPLGVDRRLPSRDRLQGLGEKPIGEARELHRR